ncbi:MAG: LamG-like jellyroll fold domain-containing protein [Thermoplasmatota archaeon]
MRGRSAIFSVSILSLIILFSVLISNEEAEAQPSSDESLVLHYTFDEDGINDVQTMDVSGSSHDGTLRRGARVVSGSLFDRGLKLDGTGGYILVESDLDCDRSVSIEMWILPESDLDIQYLALIDDGYAQNEIYHRILLGDVIQNNNGRLLTQFNGNFFSNRSVIWDRWNHIAYVYDYDDNRETYYINGRPAGSQRGHGGPGWSGNGFTIGRQKNEDRYRFAGMMDEIRIFNRPLSRSEIEKRYSQGEDIFLSSELRLSNIAASSDRPWAGDDVDLHVVVYNDGYGPAFNVNIMFLDGKERIGEEILLDFIGARDHATASTNWTAVEGLKNIHAVVVGSEDIRESRSLDVRDADRYPNIPIVRMSAPNPIMKVNSHPEDDMTYGFEINFSADFPMIMENEYITLELENRSGNFDLDVPPAVILDTENPSTVIECRIHVPRMTSSSTVHYIQISGNWRISDSGTITGAGTSILLDVLQYYLINAYTALDNYHVNVGEVLSVPVELTNLGNGYDTLVMDLDEIDPVDVPGIDVYFGTEVYGLDEWEQTTGNILISPSADAETGSYSITIKVMYGRMSAGSDPVVIEYLTFVVEVTEEEDYSLFLILCFAFMVIACVLFLIIVVFIGTYKQRSRQSETLPDYGIINVRYDDGTDVGSYKEPDDIPKPGMASRPPGF